MSESTGEQRTEVRVLAPNPKSVAFLAFYDLAGKSTDLLHETLDAVIPIPQTGGAGQAIHQWAIYLGTLAEEIATAAEELAMLDLLRAASILVRQLYEYRIKFEYLARNEDKALALMNSLEKRVHQEAENAGDYFSSSERTSYEENYRAWALKNPELDSQNSEKKFRAMLEAVKGKGFETEYFRCYSAPSIIAHGQPHGIIDVLSSEDGGRVKRHYWQSRTQDGISLLSSVIAYSLEFSLVLRARFGMDMSPVKLLNEEHGVIQDKYGHEAGRRQGEAQLAPQAVK